MHSDEVGVVLHSRKSTLDIVVSCMSIMAWIRNGEIPVPNTELVERISKVERRFVHFISPVIDCKCSWPRSKTAVGEGSRFATLVQYVNKTLGGEVDVECKMDKVRVHNQHKTSFALLDNRLFEDCLIVADRRVVVICTIGLKVFFAGFCVAECRGSEDKDSIQIRPDIGVDNIF